MKNLGKEEEYIRQFISELGAEAPSVDFHNSILKKLNPYRSVSVYKSVISPLAWKIIGGAVTLMVISVLLFLPSGDYHKPLFNLLPAIPIPQLAINLPKVYLPVIKLSTIVIQSLLVFILLIYITIIVTIKKLKVS